MEHLDGTVSKDDASRLKALFEMASDGIITIDTNGVIENVNKAACRLFGYPAEELWGQKVNLLMASHDRKHHDEYLERYHQTRSPHIIGIGREVTGRRKDGSEFQLRLSVSEVALDDKTIYTGILHDVTAINEAKKKVEKLNQELENKVEERTVALLEREAQLRQALNKEKELSELKSRFLSMASHEFKTPLSTVLSSAEIIGLYENSDQQPQREKHIDRIKDAVIQLTEVLNDFLSLSQLEQGVITVSPKLIDLQALLSTVVERSEGQLKEDQKIELQLDEAPRQIVSDPKLLQHVLLNLVSNALKYSAPGAVTTIESGTTDDQYFIRIKDQGMGIPPEDHKHLFDRFFRARNVENVKGTGLGLNIVKQYVELLEGTIAFSSEVDKGSVFTVLLPL